MCFWFDYVLLKNTSFFQVTIFLHFLWVGPLQAAAVVGLLWQEIGPSCLAGMAVLVFLLPLQSMFGKLFSKFRCVYTKTSTWEKCN